MRNMSFSLTTDQIRNRTKTVTRRMGWLKLKPGDRVQAVEKCQGLKRGEKVKPLAVLMIKSVSREVLSQIIHRWEPGPEPWRYGHEECAKEGFPGLDPRRFVKMFCATHKGCTEATEITRIEFEYVEGDCPPSCASRAGTVPISEGVAS